MRQLGRPSQTASEHRPRIVAFGSLILTVLTAVVTPGCCLPDMIRAASAPYEACIRREAIKYRAAAEARRIWIDRYAGRPQSKACERDMRNGFTAGFVETALGGTGCPPPVPTKKLCGVRTLTHTYPNANAWYQGYDLGHAAALSRGADQWRLAPLDPGLRAYAQACSATCLANGGAAGAIEMIEPAPRIETEPPYGLAEPYTLAEPIVTPDPEPAATATDE